MAKILKNTTASPVAIADTGITIPASPGTYTIPAQDYLLWAASSNVITYIGSGALVVNDGSTDLSISDGTDHTKGNFPSTISNTPLAHAPNKTNTGTMAALNAAVTITTLDGFTTAGVVITGTWVGTITFQGSVDGTNYNNMPAQPLGSGPIASTTTVNGAFRLNISGIKSYRVIMTSYTSGTATVSAQTTVGPGFARTVSNIAGNTDGTQIGNVTDNLKVIDQAAITVLNSIAIAVGAGTGLSIFKFNEAAVTARTEFDLSGTTYTVPTGKTFVITSFCGSYDAQAALYLRLKKQTGGTGAWVTQFRMTMMSGGQGDATTSMNFGSGIAIGVAGDVFKLTVESSIAKGTIWGEFSGSEI